MSEDFVNRVASVRKTAETRRTATDVLERPEDAPQEEEAAYSHVGPDRGPHKIMVELRLLSGKAKALSYAYLVALDFDPEGIIDLDFTGWQVRLEGRNLRPLFEAIASNRVSRIKEANSLLARTLPEKATVVTSIQVKERT
jgi:hypothetical protein